MKISLIIPAYNEERFIGACLDHCTKNKSADIAEIVVVDNASTDRTAEIAASFAGVRVVREPRKGPTFARQCGLMHTTGELVAYIDADTLPTREWFRMVDRIFADHPELVALSGPCDYYDLPLSRRVLVSLYWQLIAIPAYVCTRYMLIGGNFIARRDALLTIGGFDTTIAFYGDDTDIARRLSAVGRIRFLPSLVMQTSGRRLREEGILRVAVKYMMNFLSEVFLHRPVSGAYKDIR